MTAKEARGCITRTFTKFFVSPAEGGVEAVFDKMPTPSKLAKEYPNGYTVRTEEKIYAVPVSKFMEIAEVVE